jgi:6-phosphogluconolactonase
MTGSQTPQLRWHPLNDRQHVAEHLSKLILAEAKQCIQARGRFLLVLAGGSTPESIYRLLASADKHASDWRAWHIYYGDERALPAGHAERNDTMAQLSWLDHCAIPANQIHAIAAELPPEQAVDHYRKLVDDIEAFDLVLLGLGEDGHTASLFPHNMETDISAKQSVLSISNASKAPAQRISLSYQRLSQAHAVWFIVTGENKKDILEQWRTADRLPAPPRFPAQWISPAKGVDIFYDQDASEHP